ncbi:HNH endonuclease [Candidatus Pacearchaeota archaeon]|nr:HNH endonuclease [Candidatus Pacearchaeota archaeon]
MNKRKSVPKSLREKVWSLVSGRCHICGKRLKKNAKKGEYGGWHVGHIKAHARGGSQAIGNLLPTCRDCNLILKHSGSKRIKKILRLGVWGEAEIRGKTKLGKQLSVLYRNRKLERVRRRNDKKG